MGGGGNDRPVTLVAETVVAVTVEPGMPGPVMVEPGRAPEMGAVSRDAASQGAPGMASGQAVGANAGPLSGGAGMASAPMETVPMEIVPRAIGLLGIGPTGPAAAQIGSRPAIVPDLSAVLQTVARRSGVPLTAVPRIGVLLSDALVAAPLAVLPVVLVPGVLGLAGPMSPALMVAVIAQGPGRRLLRWMPWVPQARPSAIAMSRRPI